MENFGSVSEPHILLFRRPLSYSQQPPPQLRRIQTGPLDQSLNSKCVTLYICHLPSLTITDLLHFGFAPVMKKSITVGNLVALNTDKKRCFGILETKTAVVNLMRNIFYIFLPIFGEFMLQFLQSETNLYFAGFRLQLNVLKSVYQCILKSIPLLSHPSISASVWSIYFAPFSLSNHRST